MGDDEIGVAVGIEVGGEDGALIAPDDQSGFGGGKGGEGAVAAIAEQQRATGIEAVVFVAGGEPILGAGEIGEAVAIEVGGHDRHHGAPLGGIGQGPVQEAGREVEEDRRGEGGGAQAVDGGLGGDEQIGDRSAGEFAMGGEEGGEPWEIAGEAVAGPDRNHGLEGGIEAGLDDGGGAGAGEIAEDEFPGSVGGALVGGVEAPVAGDQVDAAVAIEVGGGEGLPESVERCEAAFAGGFDEGRAALEEDADGAPFAGQGEIDEAIAIEIRQGDARHQPDLAEGGGPYGVEDELAVAVEEDAGVGGAWVVVGEEAAGDDEVGLAIPIEIGRGHGAGGGGMGGEGGAGFPAGAVVVEAEDGREVGVGGFEPGEAGEEGNAARDEFKGEQAGDVVGEGVGCGDGFRYGTASIESEGGECAAPRAAKNQEPALRTGDPSEGRTETAEPVGKEGLGDEVVELGFVVGECGGQGEGVEERLGEGRRGGGGLGLGLGLGPGFMDFVEALRPDSGDAGVAAGAPEHLDFEMGGGAGGEGDLGLVGRQVTGAGPDFLFLDGDGTALESHSGAEALGVGGNTAETDGDPGCGGVVAVDEGTVVPGIGDEVEVAVVVEIGEGHAMGDAEGVEAPGLGMVGEAEISEVAPGGVGRGEGWVVEEDVAGGLLGAPGRFVGTPGVDIEIVEIVGMPVGDQEILEAVEIHIEEDRRPGPVRHGHTGEPGDFGVGAVATIPLEGVPGKLGSGQKIAGGPDDGFHGAGLGGVPGVVAAEHLDDDEVEVAVAVEVGGVDAHRGVTHVAERQTGYGAEGAAAIAEPETVGGLKVTAGVDVGITVAIEVANLNREGEVLGCRGHRATVLVEKVDVPRGGGEPSLAIVQEDDVCFAEFDELPFFDPEPVGIRACDLGASTDRAEDEPGAVAADGFDAEATEVEIEVAVAIEVGEGRRSIAAGGDETGGGGDIGKPAVAEVDQQGIGSEEGGDVEIGPSVAIDIGRHGAGGDEVGEGDASLGGDIGEAPAAEVAVQGAAALFVAHEDVAPAIAVEVGQGDPRTVHEIPSGAVTGWGELVGTIDADGPGAEEGEAGLGWGRIREGCPGEAGSGRGGAVGRRSRQQGSPSDGNAKATWTEPTGHAGTLAGGGGERQALNLNEPSRSRIV